MWRVEKPSPYRDEKYVNLRLEPLRSSLTLFPSHIQHDIDRLSSKFDQPGSTFRRDRNNAEREAEAEGTWGADVFVDVLGISTIGLVSTANLVRSIGRLLYAPVSLKGVEVLARTALEAAARSWWLLDPDIAPRERVTRGAGDALHGLRADARMLGKTGNRELVKSAQS
jgi:hypothetical protein